MTELERRIYRIAKLLGARSDLLAILGSYKDTLSDEEFLIELDNWLLVHDNISGN